MGKNFGWRGRKYEVEKISSSGTENLHRVEQNRGRGGHLGHFRAERKSFSFVWFRDQGERLPTRRWPQTDRARNLSPWRVPGSRYESCCMVESLDVQTRKGLGRYIYVWALDPSQSNQILARLVPWSRP